MLQTRVWSRSVVLSIRHRSVRDPRGVVAYRVPPEIAIIVVSVVVVSDSNFASIRRVVVIVVTVGVVAMVRTATGIRPRV